MDLDLGPFVTETLEQWRVPGAGVAVVKDGETILCDGFGSRNVERGLPMTPDTLMPIGSCTKAFTAMCLALLVEEGKLDWDKPLREYMPRFKLKDEFATARMTPRDLLCHRSGLPRHDLLWYGGNWTREQVFERLQYVEPSADFRTTFQYQNMMYMVAGLLVTQITGKTWEEFLGERILAPLGMNRTNTSTRASQQDADHSRPYKFRHGELKEIPYYEADENEATGPAGTINSCVSEMANWLRVHLGTGGSGLPVSTNNLAEMHKPHIFLDDAQQRKRFGFEFQSYGLGWFLHSHRGEALVHHGGNIDGFSALTSFIPRRNIGVVVLTNGDGIHNAVPSILTYAIYDRLLGIEEKDWSGQFKQVYDELLAAMDKSEAKSQDERRSAPPSHPLDDYLGEYEHAGYGVYSVRREGAGLALVLNGKHTFPLAHYHYDIFDADAAYLDTHFKLSFSGDTKGNIAGFSMQVEPMTKEAFFARLPDKSLADPALLARFAGKYQLHETTMEVALREGKLFLTLPGQEYELVPYRGTEFTLKGLSGFSVEFKADEQGGYETAIITQPGAVFTATRSK